MPTTGRAQPARSIFAIRPGSADSDEDVPITISSSSRISFRIFQRLKPNPRAMPPSTAKMKIAQVR